LDDIGEADISWLRARPLLRLQPLAVAGPNDEGALKDGGFRFGVGA
jgi:hypothetical protein